MKNQTKAEIRETSSAASGSRPLTLDPRRVVEVSAGLIFRGGRLLITQRYPGAHLGGLWEFPGGKRQPSETFESCLERELMEELGVKVRVGQLFESIEHVYPEKPVHLRFYLCRLQQGEPSPLGCAAVRWVTADELVAHDFPEADQRLLERLQSHTWIWAE